MLGICNGFQALVNLGLLPGFDGDYRSRSVALIANECGNFRNQWVRLAGQPRVALRFHAGNPRWRIFRCATAKASFTPTAR